MDHQIRSEFQWALQHRGGKGIFAGQRNLEATRALSHRKYVDNFNQGVGWGFQPEEFGLGPARPPEFFDVPHVDERMLQPPSREQPGDELPDAEV